MHTHNRIIIFCALILASFGLFAEEPHYSISIDPIWLAMNCYRVSGEYSINRYFSATIQGTYSPNYFFSDNDYSPITYLEYGLGGRFYAGGLLENWANNKDFGKQDAFITRLFQPAPEGIYAGLGITRIVSTSQYSYAGAQTEGEIKGWGLGVEMGARYLMGKRRIRYFVEPYIRWSLYYSGGYNFYDETGNATTKPFGFDDSFNNKGLIGGINVGLQY